MHEIKQNPLTADEKRLYDCLCSSLSRGFCPTVRELCVCLGIKSTATVVLRLDSLAEKGFITRDPKISRSIRLTDLRCAPRTSVAVPVLDPCRYNPSRPPLSPENIVASIDFPLMQHSFEPSELFAVRVSDNSLAPLLFAGDYAVARKCFGRDRCIGASAKFLGTDRCDDDGTKYFGKDECDDIRSKYFGKDECDDIRSKCFGMCGAGSIFVSAGKSLTLTRSDDGFIIGQVTAMLRWFE